MRTKVSQFFLAVVLALVTVLVVGFLRVEIELTAKGALMDLGGNLSIFFEKRFPWELQAAAVAVVGAVVVGYRKFVRSRAARLTVLTVLSVAAIISGFAYIPSQTVWLDIFSRCFIEGGSSPFNLVFIGGVLADLVLRRDGDHDRSKEHERVA
ncbi:hypothetical protein AB0N24_27245 [Arthrobacter sp. NPDC093128]|jgi:hypothetical protein|uniref:hypothetical protein n=1 Tax=Arthrobacter sp. NPDC093128 TaxID=3154979 RepID=UPI003445F2B9